MSLQRWMARTPPKGAFTLVLFVQNQAHTTWPKDHDELRDFSGFAKACETIGEEVAEESGAQCAMRVAWFNKREQELPAGYSWSVGFSAGQALLDGSSNASAVNAQRHLEAMVRNMVSIQQNLTKQSASLIDGFKMLSDTARARAMESDGEARMLRSELKAWRERDADGLEVVDDGPSALDNVMDKLTPEQREQIGPLVFGLIARLVSGGSSSAAASSAGQGSGETRTETTVESSATPTDSTNT